MKKNIHSISFALASAAAAIFCGNALHGQSLPDVAIPGRYPLPSHTHVVSDTALIFRGHTDVVRFADYSPDGHMIITGDLRETIVWDPSTGTEICRCADGSDLASVAFRPDSRSIIAADRRTALIVSDLDISTTKSITLPAKTTYWDARYSPDGLLLISTHRDSLVLWNPINWSMLRSLYIPNEVTTRVRFSRDGSKILTCGGDTVRVWNVATGQVIARILKPKGVGRYLANFSPDGMQLVLSLGDTTAYIVDSQTGTVYTRLEGHAGIVRDAMYSSDGRYIVTASDDATAKIWDAANGDLLQTLTGHIGEVLGAQFSPDGTRVLTVGADSTARVWGITKLGVDKPVEIGRGAGIAVFPNIIKDNATISYRVGHSGHISLGLFDVLGREIVHIEEGYSEAGAFARPFDIGTLASGSYFMKLRTETDSYCSLIRIEP